ncbi:hypothetical protein Catovirus_1_604 [Catovirus CTV1]|uniref:Uncharacterized protein n=1 Tax=Catovirus CTV1 TaxID=1977631 RepID=A0A1V0SA46_9VIRU|nr:hypothetical protein Catovirus_1_604 [Catovirus CTV1]
MKKSSIYLEKIRDIIVERNICFQNWKNYRTIVEKPINNHNMFEVKYSSKKEMFEVNLMKTSNGFVFGFPHKILFGSVNVKQKQYNTIIFPVVVFTDIAIVF